MRRERGAWEMLQRCMGHAEDSLQHRGQQGMTGAGAAATRGEGEEERRGAHR